MFKGLLQRLDPRGRDGYHKSIGHDILVLEVAMLEKLITVDEATARYGLSGIYLRKLSRLGKIRAKKFGTSWVIDTMSLEQYLSSPRKRGRPPLDK